MDDEGRRQISALHVCCYMVRTIPGASNRNPCNSTPVLAGSRRYTGPFQVLSWTIISQCQCANCVCTGNSTRPMLAENVDIFYVFHTVTLSVCSQFPYVVCTHWYTNHILNKHCRITDDFFCFPNLALCWSLRLVFYTPHALPILLLL